MLQIRTVFRYGPNVQIGDEWKTEQSGFSIDSKFLTLTRSWIASGSSRKGKNVLTCDAFLENPKHFWLIG